MTEISKNLTRKKSSGEVYSTRISIQHGKCLVKSVGEEENQYLIAMGATNFLLFYVFMFPRGIRLPVGNRYLPGNVEKFE